MYRIENFSITHISNAREIALMNYNEERAAVPELPNIETFPDLHEFADNGLGTVLFCGDDMLGFLCCYKPWDNIFGSAAKGIFTPIHAHGSVSVNRGMIYRRLYQAAANKWVRDSVTYHAIALYTHDAQALSSFFSYGFGMRYIDAVRLLKNFEYMSDGKVVFCELNKDATAKVRGMRKMLSVHLGESPCFMRSSPNDAENWIKRAETRNSRLFTANLDKVPIAYIEVMDEGENFATEYGGMKNICGAFCMPEYRGKGVAQGLLNYVISVLKTEGYESLGVDFESFNPTASGFWLKYFTAYTHSVTRRIDECALINE